MKPFIDRFILGFPALFLEIIALGVLALWWQSAAWISQVRCEHAGNDGKFYIDQPTILWQSAAKESSVGI